MNAMRMTCRELVELVTEYFEDTLSEGDRARFEEHVLGCPPCRAHLEQMRRTIELLGHLPEESLTPEAERSLLHAFREWKQA